MLNLIEDIDDLQITSNSDILEASFFLEQLQNTNLAEFQLFAKALHSEVIQRSHLLTTNDVKTIKKPKKPCWLAGHRRTEIVPTKNVNKWLQEHISSLEVVSFVST